MSVAPRPPFIGQPDAKLGIGSKFPGLPFELARLDDHCEIGDELAATPKVAGRQDLRDVQL